MIYQIKYFLLRNHKKKFIKIVPMYLCCNSFKEEEYDSGLNKINIDGMETYSSSHIEKKVNSKRLMASFGMSIKVNEGEGNIGMKRDRKNIFETYFDLINFNKTCFTFLLQDNIFISIEIERIENA